MEKRKKKKRRNPLVLLVAIYSIINILLVTAVFNTVVSSPNKEMQKRNIKYEQRFQGINYLFNTIIKSKKEKIHCIQNDIRFNIITNTLFL